jgi:multidrug efflux system membrane fusion protein
MTRITVLTGLLAGLFFVGCGKPPALPAPDAAPAVTVSRVIHHTVTDTVEFTARLDAVNYVDIKARVTGYITQTPFKEGDYVKKGDLLFEIDKRPYKAKLDDAKSQLTLQQAKYKLAKADNLRAKEVAKTPGAISVQELDKYQAAEEEAKAAVEAIAAANEVHELNLEFCRVIAPIDGRISRYYFTLGNLVNADSTLLTTLVSEDPIYVYFDSDERTILKVKRLVQEGKIPVRDNQSQITFQLALQDETEFKHTARVNFINNKLDPLTGTITVRGILDNPSVGGRARLFVPGMFCRVKLPIGQPRDVALVSERAVGTDQGNKFVYVVGDDNKAVSRRVRLGALQPDGLRVIEEGVQPGERVVVTGIQMVRQGEPVTPEEVAMPVTTGAGAPLTPAPQPAPKPAAPANPGNPAGTAPVKTAPAKAPAGK